MEIIHAHLYRECHLKRESHQLDVIKQFYYTIYCGLELQLRLLVARLQCICYSHLVRINWCQEKSL